MESIGLQNLDPLKSFENIIRDFLKPHLEHLPFNQKVVVEAEKQAIYIKRGLGILLELTKDILDPQDQEALARFIRQRSEGVAITQRSGFLI